MCPAATSAFPELSVRGCTPILDGYTLMYGEYHVPLEPSDESITQYSRNVPAVVALKCCVNVTLFPRPTDVITGAMNFVGTANPVQPPSRFSASPSTCTP